MRSTLISAFLTLLMVSLPIHAKVEEIVNVTFEQPASIMTPQNCLLAMEQCPEVEAEECLVALKKVGCEFLPGQKFHHLKKYPTYTQEQCVKNVESCLIGRSNTPKSIEQCKADLDNYGCVFTPDQKFTVPEMSFEETLELIELREIPDAPPLTREECAEARRDCPMSPEICNYILKDCPA